MVYIQFRLILRILKYYHYSNELLCHVNLPRNAICCTKLNCQDTTQSGNACSMYNDIVRVLEVASQSLYTRSQKAKKIKPGWNKFVASHHAEANEAHRAWVIAGRPRQGPVLESKKKTNAKYKYALRYISKQEQALTAHSMVDNLLKNDVTSFWKEEKSLHRAKTGLPCNIEGVSDPVGIADLWRKHYAALFNSVKGELYLVGTIAGESIVFNSHEVLDATRQLTDRKASGLDDITAEHLK